ncbi:MAG: hypothetical protein HY904_12240 [Deltaproteobacteria bacterium]|nr:hypothetical protein [Deltaproteobacteria bacterium]
MTDHKFTQADLVSQLFKLTPVAWEQRADFVAKGYPDAEAELVEAHRLVEIGASESANRIGAVAETKVATLSQADPRTQLIAARDAAKDLQNDAGLEVNYFNMNFPAGDAANLVTPALVLAKMLEKHGTELKNPIMVADLVEDVKRAQAALTSSELKQESGKIEQKVPAADKARASKALYARLLSISRRGRVINRKAPDKAALYSLNVLFGGTAPGGENTGGDEGGTGGEDKPEG